MILIVAEEVEEVALTFRSLSPTCGILEIILGLVVVLCAVISDDVEDGVAINLHQLQALLHTAIAVECILLVLDGLDLRSDQVAVAVCIVPVIIAILVLGLVQIVTRNDLEPGLAVTCTILRAGEVHEGLGVVSITLSTLIIRCGIPVSDHTAILIEAVLLAVNLLVQLAVADAIAVVGAVLLLTGALEIEPTDLVLIPEAVARLCIFCIIVGQSDLSPANGHSTVVLIAEVVLSLFPSGIAGLSLTIAVTNPAVKHSALAVESVGLAARKGLLEDVLVGIALLQSLAVCLEIVPVDIRLILVACILVVDCDPAVGNHCTVGINIVVLIVVLDKGVGNHNAVLTKIEPVSAGLFPLVRDTLTVLVVINP